MGVKLTKIEQKVLEAIDNEAMTVSREKREAFQHHLNVYRNAAVYADQWGLDLDKFRRTVTAITGVTAQEAASRLG